MPEIKKSKHAAELEVLLSVVEKAANLMQAERATLFLHDAKDYGSYIWIDKQPHCTDH